MGVFRYIPFIPIASVTKRLFLGRPPILVFHCWLYHVTKCILIANKVVVHVCRKIRNASVSQSINTAAKNWNNDGQSVKGGIPSTYPLSLKGTNHAIIYLQDTLKWHSNNVFTTLSRSNFCCSEILDIGSSLGQQSHGIDTLSDRISGIIKLISAVFGNSSFWRCLFIKQKV